MAVGELGIIEGQQNLRHMEGPWLFDDDDWALIAQLKDPITCSELLFQDPRNHEYGGCYHVRDYQYPLFRASTNYEIYPCSRDVGKALANGEPVLTPEGYVPIESLRTGDLVIGSDGAPNKVLGVYPQGERDIYRMTFRYWLDFDDSQLVHVDCDLDHLWPVWDQDATGWCEATVMRLRDIIYDQRRLSVNGLFEVGPAIEAGAEVLGEIVGDRWLVDTYDIVEIKRLKRGQATCIKVEAADGQFVTRGGVLTHNTESLKAKAVTHAFKRMGEDMLITAPELVHLQGVTPFIEQRIKDTRLTRDFLVTDSQRTGFTHKPFQVDFADGTRIVGRIPHQSGRGVKGAHVPDLLMDESQDYPEAGWVEVFPTVLKDHVDRAGKPDFTMQHYGVHAAGRGGTFARYATSPSYNVTQITQCMKEGWNKAQKQAAAAAYGGTNTPDYRRNILGEPGTSWSQFFVTARLMACCDQDEDSKYNQMFVDQSIQAEELPRLVAADGDVGDLLDLPEGLGQEVYAGMDVGLVSDPTVIMLFAVLPDEKRQRRLTLVRMIHLWRFTEGQIRKVTYRIARQYGKTLRAFGQDITGLGLPLYQAMEADERCPSHLKEVAQGYVFNAKVPVSVDPNFVSREGQKMEDQYGHMVEVVRDKWTGKEHLVARMTMIEASTRYLRKFVDDGFLRLPFHPDLVKDFQGESEQRVKAMAGVKKKPNAFHMLDAARAMAMAYKQGEVDEQVYQPDHGPVLDRALDLRAGMGSGGGGMGMS